MSYFNMNGRHKTTDKLKKETFGKILPLSVSEGLKREGENFTGNFK